MSMSWKKKFHIRDSGLHSINWIFGEARAYSLTSEQLNTRYLEYVNRFPKVPNWIKSYWNGVHDLHIHLIYRHELEFCYIVNGIRVSNRKESPIYYEKMGIGVQELTDHPNGFFWIKSGKPFFIGENKKEN